MQLHKYPSWQYVVSKRTPFFALFALLVKKSKDVHSYKIQSVPIIDVGNGKVGEVGVLATFL